MKNLKLDKLANHAVVDTGFPFKSERFTDDSNDIPLVKGENLQQGYIDWNAAKYWSKHDTQNYKKYWLETDDVVLAMDRPWVQAGLKWSCIRSHHPKAFLVQRVARLRAKRTIHQKFLRCLIGSEYFSSYIQPIVTGVNIPHISAKQIGDFLIPILPFPVQEKVASIVSAYDDLIENNDRRITLLEKMAEEIYREWFVRLRFPEHEQVTFHKGIPESWKEKSLSDICVLQSGYAFKSADFTDDDSGRIVVRMGNFKINHGLQFDDNTKYLVSNIQVGERFKLESGDMLIVLSDVTRNGSIIGNIGIVPKNDKEYVLNQRVSKIKIQKEYYFYLYGVLSSKSFKNHCLSRADSATVLNLSNKDFYAYKLLLPPDDLIDKFSVFYKSYRRAIMNLSIANQKLKQTRDRLLTRLISGKLSVEDLDIQLPPSMTADS